MSSHRAWFWPWGRAPSRARAPDPPVTREDDDLSAAMRALHLAESYSSPQLPDTAVRYARQLCRLGFEHRQLADELEATAQLHRDSASRVGWQAASALGVGHSGEPAEPDPDGHRPATEGPRTTPDPPGQDAHQADVVVRVLGQLDVRGARGPVTSWGGQRTRTLFQYLLMHRRPVHREVLMELLWPGHTYSSARSNLNVCIYGVRRALSVTAPEVRHVVYRDGCYTLNRALAWEVDRDRFVDATERARRTGNAGSSPDTVTMLERAVSAYGGPLFEGDPAADWFLAERTALHELFLQVLERLAGLLIERGDIDGAQRTLERLLREDGCRESAHRLLMSCFARRGQRDLVARQFQRCIARLQADLDITPSTETVDLFRTLTRAG